MKHNYYQILGVSKEVTEKQLKKRYRELAKQYHPDKNPGNKQAEQKFKEIAQAYQILSDPKKKQTYDLYGTTQFDQQGFNWNNFTHGFEFQDILKDIFGDSFFRNFTHNFGNNINQQQTYEPVLKQHINISLTVQELYKGTKKKFKLNIKQICKSCNGSGSQDGTVEVCQECNGQGKKIYSSNNQTIIFQQVVLCPSCKGTGKIIKNPCKGCNGKKFITVNQTVLCNIPGGITLGTSILIYKDQLNQVIATVNDIKPGKYAISKTNKLDIIYSPKLNIIQAIKGVKIKFKYLNGQSIQVAFDQGCSNQNEIVFPNKGLRSICDGSVGNLIVKPRIQIPKFSDLTKQQQEFIINLKKR